MRLTAEVHLEAEQYVDLLPSIDVSAGIPSAGDELQLDYIAYTCSGRRFVYDRDGRLRSVALFVTRSETKARA
jgi:hypothetical protein